jgi:type I restriction enzyme S subunit
MEFNADLPALPKGWEWTTISQLVAPSKNSIKRGPFGSSIKKAFFTKNGFKVYEQQNAIYDNHKLGNYYISQDKFDELKDFEVKPGDFIISCSGTIGKIALIPEKAERGIINQALLKLTIDRSLVIPMFFLEYFRFEKFQKKLLKETRGSAIKNINSVKEIKSIPFPLPPLPEQNRIVNKIEELFTKLDAGVDALKKIKIQLKRYRQAVLKNAFEGKLTQQWREAHKGELVSASVLLEKIKEQRKKESKEKFKELPPIDTSELPELPEGWVWVKIIDLLGEDGIFIDGDWVETKDQDPNGDVRLIQLADIGDGFYRNRSNRFLTIDKAIQLNCTFLQPNDVLIARMPDPLGRACIFPGDSKPCVTVVDVCIIRPNLRISNKRWLMHMINAVQFRSGIEKLQSGSTRKRISRNNLSKLFLPLSPLPEQHQIVAEIESRLSVADQLEKVVEQSLKQAERLRQSILKKAFEGKLVPQDPTDEPAEKLLERIKEEKENRSLIKQKSRKRK